MLVVIGTDCIGSYKSKYHTITTPTTVGAKGNYVNQQICSPEPATNDTIFIVEHL
jgi:hypothetical protein